MPVPTTTRLFVTRAIAPLLPQLSSFHLTRGDRDGPLAYEKRREENNPIMQQGERVDELYRLVAESIGYAGISLTVLLEETYGIAFEAEETVRLNSVGAIREVPREKGIAL